MKIKSVFESWTFWFNVITIITLMLGVFSANINEIADVFGIDGAKFGLVVSMLINFLNILLRFKTDSKVTL